MPESSSPASPDRAYLLLGGFLLLLSLPARFAALNKSIWLDEAWVANTVLEPSLHDMFFSKAWLQSTPPLFLLLERWTVGLAGSSEASFRILPLAASLAGLLFAAQALRRWLSPPAALLGLTLLCGNYWVIKYAQQAKQYGSDFCVSGLLLLLVGRCLEDGTSQRRLAALVSAGAVVMFLSYTAVYWLPTVLICAVIPAEPDAARGLQWSDLRWKRLAWAAGFVAPSLAILYLVFIRPSRSVAQTRAFQDAFPDLTHPLSTLQQFISNVGLLLVSLEGALALSAGLAAVALAVYAAARAVLKARSGQAADLMVLLAGVFPLGCALTAGVLKMYPVFHYPRMLLFALPSLALWLGYAIDALLELAARRWGRSVESLLRAPLFVGCAAAVLVSQFIYFHFPRPAEENRPAIAFIQSRQEPDDLVFIHGGMYEQFKYYRTAMAFRPRRVYIGAENWPCCATGDVAEATDPAAKDFADDLSEAARRARGHNLWLLVPAGTVGHWSSEIRGNIDAIPTILARVGCRPEEQKLNGQTLVASYACR